MVLLAFTVGCCDCLEFELFHVYSVNEVISSRLVHYIERIFIIGGYEYEQRTFVRHFLTLRLYYLEFHIEISFECFIVIRVDSFECSVHRCVDLFLHF